MEAIRFIIRAASLTCVLALGSIAGAGAATDTVKVGVPSVSPTNAIFFAARELGLYAAQNLDVDIQTFRGTPATEDALAAGTIDICPIAPIDAQRAIAKGAKERIVALFAPPRAFGWYVMVAAASPITSMAGLSGKTVGVPQSGAQPELWLRRAALSIPVTLTTTPLDGSAEAALRAKRVDAAVIGPIASYRGLASGGLRALYDFEPALPPSITAGIGVNQALIERRSDVLRRWLSATSKAVRYMQDNESWTEAFLKRYFEDTDDQTVAAVYRNIIMKMNAAGEMHRDWMQTSLAPATPVAAVTKTAASAVDTVFLTAFTTAPKTR
jgi:NitT/TauT family transport system substrate-binding protein